VLPHCFSDDPGVTWHPNTISRSFHVFRQALAIQHMMLACVLHPFGHMLVISCEKSSWTQRINQSVAPMISVVRQSEPKGIVGVFTQHQMITQGLSIGQPSKHSHL
jgi:hypothetical protein